MQIIKSLILIVLLGSAHAYANSYDVNIAGHWVQFSGQVEQQEHFVLKDVKVNFEDGSETGLYLQVEIGYGVEPLDEVCQQITRGNYPYAMSYGQIESRPFTWFSSPKAFVVLHKGGVASGFKVETYDSGTHLQNLACTELKYQH